MAYGASTATRKEAFDTWHAEVEHARRIEGAAESLDVTGHQPKSGKDLSL